MDGDDPGKRTSSFKQNENGQERGASPGVNHSPISRNQRAFSPNLYRYNERGGQFDEEITNYINGASPILRPQIFKRPAQNMGSSIRSSQSRVISPNEAHLQFQKFHLPQVKMAEKAAHRKNIRNQQNKMKSLIVDKPAGSAKEGYRLSN